MKKGERTPKTVIAAIVADYVAGMPTIEIAARHGVSDKTVNRHTLKAGVRASREVARERPRTYCKRCGKSCRAATHTCLACIRADQDCAEAELKGGRWVRRGLVHVWEPELEAVS